MNQISISNFKTILYNFTIHDTYPFKKLTAIYKSLKFDLTIEIFISYKITPFYDFQKSNFLFSYIYFNFKRKRKKWHNINIPLLANYESKTLTISSEDMNSNYSFFVTHFDLDLFDLEKELNAFINLFIDKADLVKEMQTKQSGL